MWTLLAGAALASPLNPWGAAVGAGHALVEPYLYLYPEGASPIVYGAVGLSDAVDVTLGAGAFLPRGGPTAGALELFPRFFVDPSLALVPHLYWNPGTGSVTVAPELHANHAWTRFAIVANLGWRPVLSADRASTGTLVALVAPEIRIGERYSVYVELDPTFSLEEGSAALTVVPGFGATLDPSGRHALSVGLQVPVAPAVGSASLGAFYCFVFPTDDGS